MYTVNCVLIFLPAITFTPLALVTSVRGGERYSFTATEEVTGHLPGLPCDRSLSGAVLRGCGEHKQNADWVKGWTDILKTD